MNTQNFNYQTLVWPRFEAMFQCEDWLNEYNNKHGESLGRIVVDCNRNSEGYRTQLIKGCWNALKLLKTEYKSTGDEEKRQYTYLNMANLLSTHQTYPSSCHNDYEKKEFRLKLVKKINYLEEKTRETNKINKWSHLWQGKLLLDYVKHFPHSQNRDRYISLAYDAFCKAEKLNTTKTIYNLLAETILDYGYQPEGMSQEEAISLAYEFLDKSEEESKAPSKKLNTKSKQYGSAPRKLLEMGARPIYKRELDKCPESAQFISLQLDSVTRDVEPRTEEILLDQPQGNTLQLVIPFTTQDQEDVILVEKEIEFTTRDPQEVSSECDEDSFEFPSNEELEKLYPTVIVDSAHTTNTDPFIVRKILYANDNNMLNRQIAPLVGYSHSSVSAVLIANGFRTREHLSAEVIDKICQAYFGNLEKGSIRNSIPELAEQLSEQLKIDKKRIKLQLNNISSRKCNETLSKESIERIVSLYQETKSCMKIKAETGLNIHVIVQKLEKALFPQLPKRSKAKRRETVAENPAPKRKGTVTEDPVPKKSKEDRITHSETEIEQLQPQVSKEISVNPFSGYKIPKISKK